MGIHRVQYAENYSSLPIPQIGTLVGRSPTQARAGHGRRESFVFMGNHRVQYAENDSSFPIPQIGPSGGAPRGVAKSHDEVTFYRFHNTYYTTLLTYPREIKNSELIFELNCIFIYLDRFQWMLNTIHASDKKLLPGVI